MRKFRNIPALVTLLAGYDYTKVFAGTFSVGIGRSYGRVLYCRASFESNIK